MWRSQAETEGLTLVVADSKTGYFGVSLKNPGKPKPYQARVKRSDKDVHLGSFATAEEAALCIARSPEGQEAAKRAAEAPPLTSEEARQQARAEGLSLLKAGNKSGYYGVNVANPGQPKPYRAKVWRGGKTECLGCFATAEEAALCFARSPEGQGAAERAAPQLSEEEGKGTVPPMPPGAFVKEEDVPAAAAVKEEGAVPPMPPDAFVVKTEAVVKEEGSSGSRPKRQRRK